MRTQLILTKCSKCRRIKVNSNWLPAPRFLARDANYTYAYCPGCLSEELAMVEKHSPVKALGATVVSAFPHPAHA